MREIHYWPVNSPHKWPVTRRIFPFDDVIVDRLPVGILEMRCTGQGFQVNSSIKHWIYETTITYTPASHPIPTRPSAHPPAQYPVTWSHFSVSFLQWHALLQLRPQNPFSHAVWKYQRYIVVDISNSRTTLSGISQSYGTLQILVSFITRLKAITYGLEILKRPS